MEKLRELYVLKIDVVFVKIGFRYVAGLQRMIKQRMTVNDVFSESP